MDNGQFGQSALGRVEVDTRPVLGTATTRDPNMEVDTVMQVIQIGSRRAVTHSAASEDSYMESMHQQLNQYQLLNTPEHLH